MDTKVAHKLKYVHAQGKSLNVWVDKKKSQGRLGYMEGTQIFETK